MTPDPPSRLKLEISNILADFEKINNIEGSKNPEKSKILQKM